jgi:hypothetical protein
MPAVWQQQRRYQLDDDFLLFMCDEPFGMFEHYIQCMPEMFYEQSEIPPEYLSPAERL